MKLIIQIPCFNEGQTLPITLAELPRMVAGFAVVEWLVIDDGSTDDTSSVALAHGVDHLVRLPVNSGLARAFMAGIRSSLANGADVIVNIDADNQYNAADIPLLLAPIITGESGFVIGIRPVYAVENIPPLIKLLHKVGSLVVMRASGTRVTDPPSGFRAFTREVAEKLDVHNSYTYTIETIIQAGKSGTKIATVPVRVNLEKLRPSRLMTSPYSYVVKSAVIILQSLLIYDRRFFLLHILLPPGATALFALLAIILTKGTIIPITVFIASAFMLLMIMLISLPVLFSSAKGQLCGDRIKSAPLSGKESE